MKKWYVAYTLSRHEKKVSERLFQMGIENFCPIQQEVRQWRHRRQKVNRVVIPLMVFVHADAQERARALTLPSVCRYLVLRGEHTPAVVPDEQMQRFKFMLDYSDRAVEMCPLPLSPGETVRVIKGPLAGLEGELVEIGGQSKVVVRLDLLGCAGVDMPVGFVEKLR